MSLGTDACLQRQRPWVLGAVRQRMGCPSICWSWWQETAWLGLGDQMAGPVHYQERSEPTDDLFACWQTYGICCLVLLTMFSFYPFIGIFITAWFKALGTVHGLHNQVVLHFPFVHFAHGIFQYFDTKEKTLHQISVFMEEHKWDYQSKFIYSSICLR